MNTLASLPRPRRRWLIDAIFLVAAFMAACLIAFEYDIFVNSDGLRTEERQIETDEALLLSTLLTLGLLLFSLRRFSEQKRELMLRMEAEIRARKALELALLDPLTGLANRRHFDDIFQAAASRLGASARHALFLMDLNDFKAINDTLGHPTGDEALKIVSERLRNGIKDGDLLSRLGGDEFAIVAFDVGNEAKAQALAMRLKQAVAAPVNLDGRRLELSISVGFCLFPDEGKAAVDIYGEADRALYVAKANKTGGSPRGFPQRQGLTTIVGA